MIVKIQRSLFTTEGSIQMLIYDQRRVYEYQGPITKAIAELMGEESKIFAKATLRDDPAEAGAKKFEILKKLRPSNYPDW